MHLLILGGSPSHPGGVEAFSERATIALKKRGAYRVVHKPTGTNYMNLARLPGLAKGIMALFRYRREKPDLVWIQYTNIMDLVYVVSAKAFGFHVMVTPHLGLNWRSQRNTLLRKLSTLMLSCADGLALISRTQEKELTLPPSVPKHYIRNFLSSGILAVPVPDAPDTAKEMQLVHSARLSAGKGTFDFIDVCAALKSAGIPFHARLTGHGDSETMATVAELIAKNELEGHVEVLGRISDSDLIEVLRKSDVLVHLSRIDSYPLIILESLMCSAFPVVLDLAGARDMVETYDGHIVGPDAPARDAAAFLIGSDIAALRARAIQGAHRVGNDYSEANCVRALENAITSTVGKELAVLSAP